MIDSSLIFFCFCFLPRKQWSIKVLVFGLKRGYDKIRVSPLQYKTPRPRKARFPSTKYWFFYKKPTAQTNRGKFVSQNTKTNWQTKTQTGHASLWSSWTSYIQKGNRVTNYWEVKLRKQKVRNNTNVLIRITQEIEC